MYDVYSWHRGSWAILAMQFEDVWCNYFGTCLIGSTLPNLHMSVNFSRSPQGQRLFNIQWLQCNNLFCWKYIWTCNGSQRTLWEYYCSEPEMKLLLSNWVFLFHSNTNYPRLTAALKKCIFHTFINKSKSIQ